MGTIFRRFQCTRLEMLNKVLIILAIIATVFVYANMAKAKIVSEGLISYWTLDEAHTEDNIAKDFYGPNDGTIYGEPKTAEGMVGEALRFNGTDDFIICGKGVDRSLSPKDAFTLESWAYWEGSGNEFVAGKDMSYRLDVMDSGINTLLQTTAHPWADWGTGHKISKNEWHHLVMLYDGSKEKTYADGVLVAQKDVKGDVIDKPTDSALFVIGSHGWNPADVAAHPKFTGRIDEVRFYDRALSEDEVKQNFRSRVVGGLAIESFGKLIGAWGKIKALK